MDINQVSTMSLCPVCNNEYTESDVNYCSVCNWDLTPSPEAFVERQNVHIAWAREIWIKLQALEKPLPTEIKAEIDANPQLSKLREESNLEIWDILIAWVCGIDVDAAKTAVINLQEKYRGKAPGQLAHILIIQKSFQAAGVELVKGVGVAQLVKGLAEVELPIIATLSAEMIYQIAAIYDLDLQSSERKLEVLAAFGVAFLGEQAFDAGIDWMKYGLRTGTLVSAGAKGLMIYAVGNAARLFYETKINHNIDPLNSSEVFIELRQNSQNYLEYAISEETIINIISNEIEAAPIIIPPPKPIKKPQKGCSPQPKKQRKDSDKYKHLRVLLAARQWEKADRETNNKICSLMRIYLGSSIGEEDFQKLQCQDLWAINQLWLKYSNGRFGFSVQKQIYETLTGSYSYEINHNAGFFARLYGNDRQQIYLDKKDKLCQRVGWPLIICNYSTYEFNYAITAPNGHLPSFTKYVQTKIQLDAFLNRVDACQL